MASKWEALDAPIREALVAGMRTSDILRAIRAGSLRGVDSPTPIADRSFYDRLKKARRTLARGGEQGGESVLERIGRDLAARDERLLAEGHDPLKNWRAEQRIKELLAEGRASDAEIAEEVGGAWTAAGIAWQRKKRLDAEDADQPVRIGD